MTFLTTKPHDHSSHAVTFSDFRDFLLLLPRKASTAEIYQYYKMKKYLGEDGRGVARVTMEGDHSSSFIQRFQSLIFTGDVSLSAEDKPPEHAPKPSVEPKSHDTVHASNQDLSNAPDAEEDEEEDLTMESHTALKFLLAGGIAGAGTSTFCS
jgi:solute carrier family 25 phosphate transporter 23/24/25/41